MPKKVEKYMNSADIKRSPAEWALRWVADFPEVLTILSGMTKMAHVEENLKILKDARPNSLTEKERGIIKAVSDIYNELIKYPCTSCGYCLPCEIKIDIPHIMNCYNEWFLFGQNKKTINLYKIRVTKGRTASDCTGCKACEERCPQQLKVTEMMAKASEIFDK